MRTTRRPRALAAVDGEEDHIGVISATLDVTESMLSMWGAMHAMRQKKVIVGFDCNETFDFNEGQVSSCTARGEAILTWAVHFGLVPSFFPYNTAQQPCRLDYVMTKGLRAAGEGRVLDKTRTMMGSDHDTVTINLDKGRKARPYHVNLNTAPKILKSGDLSQLFTLRTEMTCEWLQQVSGEITQIERGKAGFRESLALRALRQQAHQAPNARQATALSKLVWKTRNHEKREYDKHLAERAVRQDWAALKEIRAKQKRQWQAALPSEDSWKTEARAHFEGIFARDSAEDRKNT